MPATDGNDSAPPQESRVEKSDTDAEKTRQAIRDWFAKSGLERYQTGVDEDGNPTYRWIDHKNREFKKYTAEREREIRRARAKVRRAEHQRMRRAKQRPEPLPIDHDVIGRQLSHDRELLSNWSELDRPRQRQFRNRIDELMTVRCVMLTSRAALGRDPTGGELVKEVGAKIPGKRHHRGTLLRMQTLLIELEAEGGPLRVPAEPQPHPGPWKEFGPGSF